MILNLNNREQFHTLDSLTVIGRFRRYCPECATSISSSVVSLKLLFPITCIQILKRTENNKNTNRKKILIGNPYKINGSNPRPNRGTGSNLKH